MQLFTASGKLRIRKLFLCKYIKYQRSKSSNFGIHATLINSSSENYIFPFLCYSLVLLGKVIGYHNVNSSTSHEQYRVDFLFAQEVQMWKQTVCEQDVTIGVAIPRGVDDLLRQLKHAGQHRVVVRIAVRSN